MAPAIESAIKKNKKSNLPQSAHAAILLLPVLFIELWMIRFAKGKIKDCNAIGNPTLKIWVCVFY